MGNNKKILIIGSKPESLINFRGDLLKLLIKQKYKVYAISNFNKSFSFTKEKLNKWGINFKEIPIKRGNNSIIKEFKTIKLLRREILEIKPSIIIAYTIKPVIYTGLVLLSINNLNINYFPMITGLGYIFIDPLKFKFKKFILKIIVLLIYKTALKSAKSIIFQNNDDINLFKSLNILPRGADVHKINGSGVDLSFYKSSRLPNDHIFFMASRLIKDKGIYEYIKAAEYVKNKFPNSKFLLAGGIDLNPTSLNSDDINNLSKSEIIDYLGELDTEKIRDILRISRYYVLPSYREGTPRSILEALASKRPIITCDVPGCRETVIHNHNGYLIEPRSYISLAKAMIRFINQDSKKTELMAENSLELAKYKFEINKVNNHILSIIRK